MFIYPPRPLDQSFGWLFLLERPYSSVLGSRMRSYSMIVDMIMETLDAFNFRCFQLQHGPLLENTSFCKGTVPERAVVFPRPELTQFTGALGGALGVFRPAYEIQFAGRPARLIDDECLRRYRNNGFSNLGLSDVTETMVSATQGSQMLQKQCFQQLRALRCYKNNGFSILGVSDVTETMVSATLCSHTLQKHWLNIDISYYGNLLNKIDVNTLISIYSY